jgi:CheY-like chemotaxis protein
MDIQMPVMDGYESTRAIRLMAPPNSKIPIVALTANATKADIARCMAAGMNTYLPKPFTPEDLYQKLFMELKIQASKDKRIRTNTPALVDLSYLKKVSGNSEEFINEMVHTFLQSVPQLLNRIDESVTAKNWPAVSKLVHQIKPSLTLLGIHSLKETATRLEEDYRKGNPPMELDRELTQFTATLQEVLRELSQSH